MSGSALEENRLVELPPEEGNEAQDVHGVVLADRPVQGGFLSVRISDSLHEASGEEFDAVLNVAVGVRIAGAIKVLNRLMV